MIDRDPTEKFIGIEEKERIIRLMLKEKQMLTVRSSATQWTGTMTDISNGWKPSFESLQVVRGSGDIRSIEEDQRGRWRRTSMDVEPVRRKFDRAINVIDLILNLSQLILKIFRWDSILRSLEESRIDLLGKIRSDFFKLNSFHSFENVAMKFVRFRFDRFDLLAFPPLNFLVGFLEKIFSVQRRNFLFQIVNFIDKLLEGFLVETRIQMHLFVFETDRLKTMRAENLCPPMTLVRVYSNWTSS